MSQVPADLQYTRTHEWVRALPDGTLEIGITDHAQHALGDLVGVEMPPVGRSVSAGEYCAGVESVKTFSEVYSPVSGTVAAANERLSSEPEIINKDAYHEGWLLRMQPAPGAAAPALLTSIEYQKLLETDGG
jgi:glycine cleavage system H protein